MALRDFVLGSSFFVVAPFFLGVQLLGDLDIDLGSYIFTAPLFFGLLNALSASVARGRMSERQRLFWTSQVSALLVILFVSCTQRYQFTPQRWALQVALIWLAHFFAWNVVIYGLEKLFIQ